MPTDPRLPWLRLARLPGIGPVLVKRLLEHFQSPANILDAHPAALSAIEGIGTYRANQIISAAKSTLAPAEEELARIDADHLTLLTPDSPDFPPGFKNIPDPPLILYVRGKIEPADAVAIGIVGARQCSLYGREQSRRFAAELAQSGLTIVSGGARGIDTAAHSGALQANGRTLVIQGCGLRHTYPPENKDLYHKIVAQQAGAILSEFPLDAPPAKENFPPRNRIIAALSLGILVVEANLRSGSLITARLAADDYGREVFALPGPITSPASAGTHHLIKSGAAHLVDSPQDILQNLGDVGIALMNPLNASTSAPKGLTPIARGYQREPLETQTQSSPSPNGAGDFEQRQATLEFPISNAATPAIAPTPLAPSAVNPLPLTTTQQKILAAFSTDSNAALTIDDLLDLTNLPAPLLMAELTILQIHSHLTRHPANRFTRKTPPAKQSP